MRRLRSASPRTVNPRKYARSVAIIFFLLAIAGLLPGVQTGFGLLPLYAKDVWLHGLIALGGLYFGWAARGADRV